MSTSRSVMELKRQMLRQHNSQDAWIRAIYDDASITDMMEQQRRDPGRSGRGWLR